MAVVTASFFAAVFGSVISFFASWFTKQIAIRLAIVAAWVAMIAGMVAGINAGLSSIAEAFPIGVYATGLGLLPDNVDECLAVLASTRVVLWVYAWQASVLAQRAM